MEEQVHVSGLGFVQVVHPHEGLAAMLNRFLQIRLERQRVIVVIDGLAVGAEVQMNKTDLVPGVIHVVFVAQDFREFLQRSAVGVVQFRQGLGFLVRVGRFGDGIFQVMRLLHALHRGRIGFGGRLFGLDLRRGRRNF